MGEELFPDAEQILDFYHLAENIDGFGKYLFNRDEKRYVPWAENLLSLLKKSKAGPVMALLQEYAGKHYGEGVINPYTYLQHNRGRLITPDIKGLVITSVQARWRAGTRWWYRSGSNRRA